MDFLRITPPRIFQVNAVDIHHCADILLKPDELITLKTESGKEYDIMKKTWGFFVTPSINVRLKKFGYKTALVRDSHGKIFICIVEENKLDEFYEYIHQDKGSIECWLSDKYSL